MSERWSWVVKVGAISFALSFIVAFAAAFALTLLAAS